MRAAGVPPSVSSGTFPWRERDREELMLFEESTARDLNPIVEEGSANTQTSSHETEPAVAHSESSQNSNHETTALTTETSELTALATENPQSSAPEHETSAHHT